ncbi:MAG TPA: excinuclease ABC subunit UvrA [Lentisphaeria bacterium]|nr:MAG: excinuclease ABC subunit A [Lentisphaerae bacterium GWF2_38_69]HBM15097.1 excinuclease ABC subunit UvrA [Lentisphaeria bacterium]
MKNEIIIRGARQHNLKGIDVSLPRNSFIVVTGLSGSGKSSLAFDTLYAEGQRRYVESLSAYARQFLDQMQKPDVEHIEGLSPAIAIEQRSSGSNPRSTVATTTEIYDYLRLLYSRAGTPHCPKCGKEVHAQSAQTICEKILHFPPDKKIMILSPCIIGRKGEHKDIIEKLRKEGFVRARIDGKIVELESEIILKKNFKHTIEAVIDRLVTGKVETSRLSDSVETALRHGAGIINILTEMEDGTWKDEQISEHLACLPCNISFGKLEPRNFSFNSPYGACPECNGLGTKLVMSKDLVLLYPDKSVKRGAIPLWKRGPRRLIIYYNHMIRCLAEHYKFDLESTPFKNIPPALQNILLYGSNNEEIKFDFWMRGKIHKLQKPFEGIFPHLERRYLETDSDSVRERIRGCMTRKLCPKCNGARLKPSSMAVTVDSMPIHKFNAMSVNDALKFISVIKLDDEKKIIATEVINEIRERLSFLINVGLDYLSLDRESSTLSGGEAQRIRLATQLGSGLVGVIYILDEPSIGLHQRDNERLLSTLINLRNTGNTVVVVEHDLDTIRKADHIVDLGPGAGRLGGELIYSGPPSGMKNILNSATADFIYGRREIAVPLERRKGNGKFITIEGASQNNLKNINAKIPLGKFVCITGVSGSGKSTLVNDILKVALERHFEIGNDIPGKHKKISGLNHIGRAIVIDQTPIGRTPRSNPATYTEVFGMIRDLFAKLPESKARGYKPGRFSFNVKGGRCEECKGDGIKKIEMLFLPEVYVQCSSCKGKRFNNETLSVLYKGRSISDVLDMTVSEACEFFDAIPPIKRKFKTLSDVGMDYIHLGQPATTLSGGEAQRVKLATELSKHQKGHTFYILDEPTTGLHIADVEKLLKVINLLIEQGNTVLVIEHNLDVIKTADHIIDLGPEGGDRGGKIVAEGTPEQVSKSKTSFTGTYLKEIL